jgi:hypothetical protein
VTNDDEATETTAETGTETTTLDGTDEAISQV